MFRLSSCVVLLDSSFHDSLNRYTLYSPLVGIEFSARSSMPVTTTVLTSAAASLERSSRVGRARPPLAGNECRW